MAAATRHDPLLGAHLPAIFQAASEVASAASGTNVASVGDLVMTGPTGVVSAMCYSLGCEPDWGNVYPGEPLTVSGEVWSYNSASSASEDVTLYEPVVFCGAGSATYLAEQTVLAPQVGSASGASFSYSFTAPACSGSYDQPAFSFSGDAEPTTGSTGPGLYYLEANEGDESGSQILACPGTGDSADAELDQGVCADPVDTATGAYVDPVTDATLKAPGYPLTISRAYSSADTSSGPLGVGWSVPWDAGLSVDSSTGDVTFTAENGDQYVYTPDGSGGFDPPFGARSVLAETTDSSGDVTGYTLTDPSDHDVLTFNASGQLESETDATERGLTFGYNSSGQVDSITDAASQSVTLTYSGSLLSQVALPDGQDVSYDYNSGGELTSVTDPGAAEWQYTYNSAGLLATVEDPDQNVTVQNTYNSSGQVTQQEDGDSNYTYFSYTTTSSGLSETDMTAPKGASAHSCTAAGCWRRRSARSITRPRTTTTTGTARLSRRPTR
jgi:YD repeat-containing protein